MIHSKAKENGYQYNDYQTKIDSDKSYSSKVFVESVTPHLMYMLDMSGVRDKFIPVESRDMANDPLMKTLDFAGIDYLMIRGHNIYGVSARVQFIAEDRLPYNTFTIRAKRNKGGKHSESESFLQPSAAEVRPLSSSYTVQSYVSRDSNKILSIGIVRTEDLYAFYAENEASLEEKRSFSPDSNHFNAIKWSDLKEAGVKIRTKVFAENIKARSFNTSANYQSSNSQSRYNPASF